MYLWTVYEDSSIETTLVSAKTRIAPMEPSTIPRLELCGALLLAQLLASVAEDLKIAVKDTYAWTDSAVVLGWLNSSSSRLKVYVANRVSKVMSIIQASQWRYVNTKANPADLASRGADAMEVVTSDLWWKGPDWLSLDPGRWPRWPDINLSRELPEMKSPTVNLASPTQEEYGTHCSSYSHLVRVTAWILRFLHRTRRIPVPSDQLLTTEELAHVPDFLTRLSQKSFYKDEIQTLSRGVA